MWVNGDGLGIALCLLTWLLLAVTDAVVVRFVLFAWFSTPRPRLRWLPVTDLGIALLLLYQLLLTLSLPLGIESAMERHSKIGKAFQSIEFPLNIDENQ